MDAAAVVIATDVVSCFSCSWCCFCTSPTNELNCVVCLFTWISVCLSIYLLSDSYKKFCSYVALCMNFFLLFFSFFHFFNFNVPFNSFKLLLLLLFWFVWSFFFCFIFVDRDRVYMLHKNFMFNSWQQNWQFGLR